MLHQAIYELHEEGHSISSLCKIADISRQAHYQYLKRDHSQKEEEFEKITSQIAEIYEEVDGIYGYRQMTLAINRKCKTKYNYKRIYRLMKIMGIKSVTRIKKKVYTKVKAEHIAENILNREFSSNRPNEKWLTDVTEFHTLEGKVYLSAILDLHSNRIVDWNFGISNNNKLVFENFKNALKKNLNAKPLIHSDRGFQYTSFGFRKILESREIKQSMSRVGKCIDNGPMESIWGKIKSERYHLKKNQKPYQTREELVDDIEEYIYFYNEERPQKVLKGMTPLECYLMAA